MMSLKFQTDSKGHSHLQSISMGNILSIIITQQGTIARVFKYCD